MYAYYSDTEDIPPALVLMDSLDRSYLSDTVDGRSVKVEGFLLEGVSLQLESATLEDIKAVDPELVGIPAEHVAFDIKLNKNDEEYQLASPVMVTMDVSGIAEPGGEVLIYHAHVNDDESVTPEVLGPFAVDDEGFATFPMTRFSYVVVFDAAHEIEDVQAFYPGALVGSASTNDHLTFLGIYYDTAGNAHFLLAFAQNTNASNAHSKFEHITVGANTPPINKGEDVKPADPLGSTPSAPNTYGMTEATFKTLVLLDDGKPVYESPASAKGKYGGVFDINLGKTAVREGMYFGVNDQSGGQGWKIGGDVDLQLDYEILKTVAAGTSASGAFGETVTVNRGDWVIFKITLDNSGTAPLSGMRVEDILPTGVFDMSTAQMSIDGEDSSIGNWQPFNQYLFENYSSAGGFTRHLFVKAQVLPNLEIASDATYTNTTRIEGMNMPVLSDTASVVVKAPKQGNLTVSKAVTSENPNDPAPNDIEFAFRVTPSVNAQGNLLAYRINGEGDAIAVSAQGGFTLKNGQSAVFEDFPLGDFSVTEVSSAGYKTLVNGEVKATFRGEMKSGDAPVVAFENKFSARETSLTVVKQLAAGSTAANGDSFAFDVYKVVEGEDGKVINEFVTHLVIQGDSVNAGVGTAVLNGLSVGDTYKVVEDEDWAWRYELQSVTDPTGPANDGVIKLSAVSSSNVVTFTNARVKDEWLDYSTMVWNLFASPAHSSGNTR